MGILSVAKNIVFSIRSRSFTTFRMTKTAILQEALQKALLASVGLALLESNT
jgi:hypothetical protein